MQKAAPCDVREDQNRKADYLGNSGRQGCTGNTHIQPKDEDRIQNTVQNTAKAHAHHAESGAAFGTQALVHHKAGSHKGSGIQHIGGIVHRILLTGGGSTQKPHHGKNKKVTENHQQRTDAKSGKEGCRQNLTCLFILPFPQKPGNIAVGAHRQQRAAHHDQLIQRCVDADRGGGIGAQRTDKVSICQRIDGVDQKSNDGRNRHFGNEAGNRFVQQHVPALALALGMFAHSLFAPLLSYFLLLYKYVCQKTR